MAGTEDHAARGCGWDSDLPTFSSTASKTIVYSLEEFVRDVSPEQARAWNQSLPWLQSECKELVHCHPTAAAYSAVLEYELPYEFRRPDVIVLADGPVVVMELKSTAHPTQAALDQVAAYARDLRCYHASCANREVRAILVPQAAGPEPREMDGVTVVGPAGLHDVVRGMVRGGGGPALLPDEFLSPGAYSPLPFLVRAARLIFEKKQVFWNERARAATDPALEVITQTAHIAAGSKTRHLVLLTGVPGAGKTLVGLRLVHSGFLDDLAVPRPGRKPTTPAVFLSGNGPLVAVLQDALREAGGGGKTFVRGVKEYVNFYSRPGKAVPPEHLLVFDEAQRAFDALQVARKHPKMVVEGRSKSEPEHFVEFAERIPDWCVIVGLIGEGQEIHVGEEAGLVQWRQAVEGTSDPGRWTVHLPPAVAPIFDGSNVEVEVHAELNLDSSIRYHLASTVHEYVRSLLEDDGAPRAAALAKELQAGGHRWLFTRDLEVAKSYARERYQDYSAARYGLLASSKDRDLIHHGVDNSWMTTSRLSLRIGRWYNADRSDPRSCCQLDSVATEFSAQGLELDLAILAWGTDFARIGGRWSNERSGKTRGHVRDAMGLRRNAYRVLLTRGRDGTVVFLPDERVLDETVGYLSDCGMRELNRGGIGGDG